MWFLKSHAISNMLIGRHYHCIPLSQTSFYAFECNAVATFFNKKRDITNWLGALAFNTLAGEIFFILLHPSQDPTERRIEIKQFEKMGVH